MVEFMGHIVLALVVCGGGGCIKQLPNQAWAFDINWREESPRSTLAILAASSIYPIATHLQSL